MQVSLIDRMQPIEAGAEVVRAGFAGETPVLVTADGHVLWGDQRVCLHPDAVILGAVITDEAIVTGGDDGRVVRYSFQGQAETLSHSPHGWVDHVASGPQGAVAWSVRRHVFVRLADGSVKSHEFASTIGGLAFAPKGLRLAVAHYGGVSLWYPKTSTPPEFLEWKGSHLGVIWSPDGRFVITSMQEPQLHGWRLDQPGHLRMAGYPQRVRSLSWGATGSLLASSGANEIILWPFFKKEGPVGQPPKMLAPLDTPWSSVACHPDQPVVAAGNSSGLVLMIKIDDGREVLLRRPAAGSGLRAVTGLAWRRDGGALLFGAEDGQAGVIRF